MTVLAGHDGAGREETDLAEKRPIWPRRDWSWCTPPVYTPCIHPAHDPPCTCITPCTPLDRQKCHFQHLER